MQRVNSRDKVKPRNLDSKLVVIEMNDWFILGPTQIGPAEVTCNFAGATQQPRLDAIA